MRIELKMLHGFLNLSWIQLRLWYLHDLGESFLFNLSCLMEEHPRLSFLSYSKLLVSSYKYVELQCWLIYFCSDWLNSTFDYIQVHYCLNCSVCRELVFIECFIGWAYLVVIFLDAQLCLSPLGKFLCVLILLWDELLIYFMLYISCKDHGLGCVHTIMWSTLFNVKI